MLPVSLDCPFLIALYILSDVYANVVALLWYSISKALQSFMFVLYNFNIVESGVEHHKPKRIISASSTWTIVTVLDICGCCVLFLCIIFYCIYVHCTVVDYRKVSFGVLLSIFVMLGGK
jgi:hypothetical protein